MFPKKLQNKINKRIETNTLRSLGDENNLIDFSSNDYLGFAKSDVIFDEVHQFLIANHLKKNGATGSRLLTGNFNLYNETENFLSKIHQSESALLFNSGYTANLGFFSSILVRGTIVLYDEFIHASIRDGIQLSNAKSYKFKHNNCEDLERLLQKFKQKNTDIFVVTESVFSMDGDMPDLNKMVKIVENYNAYFIVDEAHALGVFGLGLVQKLNLQHRVFARVVTFGKALGCDGAVILGSENLKEYLINFCRSLIYTTGLAPHQVATIQVAYKKLINHFGEQKIKKLEEKINYFKTKIKGLNFIESYSAIQCCIVGGNEKTKLISNHLKNKGFDVKAILSPTIPKGKERLRFCLHSYNSYQEIDEVLEILKISL